MSAVRIWIAAGLIAAVPAALEAQDVKYTETTKVEAFASLPGMGADARTTTYISNGRVRTDQAKRSTIMDYADMMLTELDHESKTFYTISLEDMMASAQAMMADAGAQMEQARADAEAAQDAQDPQLKVEFDLRVEQLGDGGRVSGYATERVMLVLEAKTTSTTPDPETGEEVSGTFVFVSDMWVSKEFPGFKALEEAQMAAAEAVSADMREQMAEMSESAREVSPMGMMFGGGGFERMAEEMQKIDGTPIRTLTYQIMLPDGVEFDRNAVIDMADKPISSFSLKSAMGQAAAESMKDAVRGRLGGLLGRKKEEPKPEEAPAAQQAVLMRITNAIEEVSTGTLDDGLFRPDPDYQEKKPEWLKSTGG